MLLKRDINLFFCVKIFLFTILIINSDRLFSQNNETNNWYFGSFAGLNFELPNPPQILDDGIMLAPSGCSSISDRDGNLQFYSHGDWVFNKNHQLMDGGNITEVPVAVGQLYKNASQNSIVIPITSSEGLYYLFTVGRTHEELLPQDGLYYSIIDMTLNNGLGKVIQKNVPLITDEMETGKLTAVHHADGESIWVLVTSKAVDDFFTSFYAYKVNMDGTVEAPVVSSSDLAFRGIPSGILKFSPDGRKVACSNLRPEELDNHLFIFDFDSETGVVSNRKKLLTSNTFFEVVSVHGIEFSNDSRYLYASLVRQGMFNTETFEIDADGPLRKMLYRYDYEILNPNEYSTSIYFDTGDYYGGALQLAKDGKIYRALPLDEDDGTNYLGVINKPSEHFLEVDYVHNAVDLNGNESLLGLPNFIQSYFRTRIVSKNEICFNDSIMFEIDTYAEITDIDWDFGDGNISVDMNPNHVYNQPGVYNVSATITVNNRQITTQKEIVVNVLPSLIDNQELIQCDDDTDGVSTFNLFNIEDKIFVGSSSNHELFFYETLNAAQQDIDRITNPDNYDSQSVNQEIFVRAVNQYGCYSISSFFLKAMFAQSISLPDIVACDQFEQNPDGLTTFIFSTPFPGDDDIEQEVRDYLGLSETFSIEFYASFIDAQTKQNDLQNILIGEPTEVWVRIEGEDFDCNSISPLNLIVNPVPVINIDDEYTLCGDEVLTISGDISNYRFEWLDSTGTIVSMTRHFSPTESGTYTHIAYIYENDVECSLSKTFTVSRIEAPIFSAIEIVEGPNSGNINVSVSGNYFYEFSIDGVNFFGNSNSYTFYNVPYGEYTVYVRDINECEATIQEELYLIGFPKFFTPNDDGVNDFWRVKGLDTSLLKSIKIFDRYGKYLANLTSANVYSWNGTHNGQLLEDNDYWYEVVFSNGVRRIGHFTLKR